MQQYNKNDLVFQFKTNHPWYYSGYHVTTSS